MKSVTVEISADALDPIMQLLQPLLRHTLLQSTDALDNQAASTIVALQKKVVQLETTLKRRDKRITDLTQGMDISHNRRHTLRDIAQTLVTELNDAGWVDLDAYYSQ